MLMRRVTAVAETERFEGAPRFDALYGGLLNIGGRNLRLLKSTFNAENCICRLSWSISSNFGAIHC